MKAKRKQYSPSFKAKVALEALKDKETLAQLSKKFQVHPTQIGKWKQEFLSRAASLFAKSTEAQSVSRLMPTSCRPRSAGWNWKTSF